MPLSGTTPGAAFEVQEHHVCYITSFNALVAFSIPELPRHPKQKRADGTATPAIWCNDISAPLTVFRYLPDAVVSTIRFRSACLSASSKISHSIGRWRMTALSQDTSVANSAAVDQQLPFALVNLKVGFYLHPVIPVCAERDNFRTISGDRFLGERWKREIASSREFRRFPSAYDPHKAHIFFCCDFCGDLLPSARWAPRPSW